MLPKVIFCWPMFVSILLTVILCQTMRYRLPPLPGTWLASEWTLKEVEWRFVVFISTLSLFVNNYVRHFVRYYSYQRGQLVWVLFAVGLPEVPIRWRCFSLWYPVVQHLAWQMHSSTVNSYGSLSYRIAIEWCRSGHMQSALSKCSLYII
jgi:hypothetical protein